MEYKHLELVSSITVDESPQLMLTQTVRIHQCSLVVLNTSCTAREDHVRQLYKVRTNHIIQNNHPNLTLLSTVHRIDELIMNGIPLVVINMGINHIWLSKKTVMAHLDVEEIDILKLLPKLFMVVVIKVIVMGKRRKALMDLCFLPLSLHLEI